MKKSFFLIVFIFASALLFSQSYYWKDLAVTENSEIYIDSLSIKEINGQVYARTKTIYTTQEAKDNYVNKIKKVFTKNADKKIAKWNDFSYSINYGLYDCTNKRFKIMEIQDYRSDHSLIIRTKTKESKSKWLNVDIDTVGDHILFYICD